MSVRERKARTINFHPRTTVITGDNDTGKSSLIKTILRSFGAEPPIHDDWKQARVSALISFSLREKTFAILRQGTRFTVFENGVSVAGQFDSVTKELGPFLAQRLEFGVKLQQSSDRQSITPPPAYYFLPFYFDQDRSWNKSWNSFERLGHPRNASGL